MLPIAYRAEQVQGLMSRFFDLFSLGYSRPHPKTLRPTKPTLQAIHNYESLHPELSFNNRISRSETRSQRRNT